MMKTAMLLLRFLLVGAVLAASSPVVFGAAAANAPAPELSVALRGVLDDALEQGEPLRVTVRIETSGEGNGRVELAPASGTWADAIAVELLAASGGPVARGTAVGTPSSPRATLDRDRIAGGMWMFPASAMQALRPGDYIVRARLSLKGGAGWSGDVSSEDTPLKIIEVSTAPERVSARALARAQIAFSQSAMEEAARLLDAGLAKTPDDFELLCLRADVALAGRNPTAAMICVGRAVRMLSPQTPGPPPQILYDVQQRVFAAAQNARDAAPGNVPEWTWPPEAVLRLSEKDANALLGKTAASLGSAAPAVPTSTVKSAPAPATRPAPGTNAPVAASASPAPPPQLAGAPAPHTNANVAAASSIGTIVPSAELSDAKIQGDASGQWAVSATAGTQYGRTQYSAAQATGAPNVPIVGNSPDAWCPAVRDKGLDWLEVTFAKPIQSAGVRVRQSDASGAIVKVEAFAPDGTAHVWWEGVDPQQRATVREIVWFAVQVPKTSYPVARVKLTLNLASGPGYKQIDAVQLVGADGK